MTKPHIEWKVLPHTAPKELAPGLLIVDGEIPMPFMDLPRRMTVVRLADSRLVVWSAIALDEAGMATLEAYGQLAFLVVPNDHHRLDAAAWKARYPQLQVVAPPGSRDKIAEEVAVDTTSPEFGDPGVQFLIVPGTREHEAALLVRRAEGTTLVLNDVIGNIRHSSGFGGWLLRMMDFAGDEAHVPLPIKLMLVKDRDALRTQLQQWAEIAGLRRIVVSHGSVIADDPRQTLRDLATALR